MFLIISASELPFFCSFLFRTTHQQPFIKITTNNFDVIIVITFLIKHKILWSKCKNIDQRLACNLLIESISRLSSTDFFWLISPFNFPTCEYSILNYCSFCSNVLHFSLRSLF
jgi:hypothetical protein